MYAPVPKRPSTTMGKTFLVLPAIIPHGTACSRVAAARSRYVQRTMIVAAATPANSDSRCRYRTVW